jgi:regulatory protein
VAARARKVPRKVSERSLENAALHHLRKYAASTAQLRRVLLRRVDRSARVHGGDAEEAARWVEALLQKLARAGLLDDAALARMKADALRGAGKSARMIALKLQQKGLSEELVDQHVRRVRDEVPEMEAARTLARRKKLGPWCPKPELRRERRMKDLAALARAGFGYDVCKKVIDGEPD